MAEKFGKRHQEVMYAINGRSCDCGGDANCKKCKGRGYIQLGIFQEDMEIGVKSHLSKMFIKSEYRDSMNRIKYEYLMDRDGFTLLSMGFTGKKALEWKLKYINAFNNMEEKLKSSNLLSDEEKLKLMLFSKDPMEVASAHNKLINMAKAPLLEKIEEQKPLVAFANHVTSSSDSVDVGEFSKIVKNEHINIGRNRLFQWLRDYRYLMSNNIPYQKYIDNGYFDVIETTKDTSYGTKIFSKTLVKGKGQVVLVEKLRKEFV